MSLSGQRILVTGATSGIGRAVSLALSELGATVLLTGRREQLLAEVAAECGRGGPAHARPFDLSQGDGIVAWLQSFLDATGGPIDGMVHSAGVPAQIPLRILKAEGFERVLRINTVSAGVLMSAFLSKKVSRDGGAFVAISSVAASHDSAGLGAYAASKAAVEALVRTAASEGRARRLRFNAIAPGYVATAMQAEAESALPRFAKVMERQFLGLIPPLEVAAVCAFLVGPNASHLTGSVITLDGGLSL